jgi:hypothetical protein
MTGKEQAPRPSRRSFLQGTSLSAGAAVMLTAIARPAEATRPQSGQRKAGYRQTPHVRRVYELSRF